MTPDQKSNLARVAYKLRESGRPVSANLIEVALGTIEDLEERLDAAERPSGGREAQSVLEGIFGQSIFK